MTGEVHSKNAQKMIGGIMCEIEQFMEGEKIGNNKCGQTSNVSHQTIS